LIFQQGDIPNTAYAIKSGVIKVCNLTSNGEEKSLSFKVRDDIFPVCWIFSKTEGSLFFYQTHTDCELYVIDRKAITGEMDKSHAFTKLLFNRQVITYVNSELQVEALAQSRALLKILYTFRHLALTHGIKIKDDLARIKIPFTQQEFANFTGLTRETVTSELTKLRRDDVIDAHHKYYTINASKINDLIDDEYDPGIRISI
jgi:CRP-like cAMP-binding protein